MEAKNLIKALIKSQTEIKPPSKDKMGQYKNKYSSLDAILEAVRKPLADNGLVLSQSVESKEGHLMLVTTLVHESGESIHSDFPIIVEKNGPQGIASARTYACRYSICNLLALPSDEDDDGQAAQAVFESKPAGSNKKSLIAKVYSMTGEDENHRNWILSSNSDYYGVKFDRFDQMNEVQLEKIIKYLEKRPRVEKLA